MLIKPLTLKAMLMIGLSMAAAGAEACVTAPTGQLPRASKPEGESRTKSFIFVGNGSEPNGQFTESEFQYIAAHYDAVYLTKFHGHWSRELQNEAARRLVQINPKIRVFPYFPASYRFDRDEYGRESFRNEWLLRDWRTQEPIRQSRQGDERGTFIDLSNPGYRRWALEIIADWMRKAPYAGIYFDNANPLEESDSEGGRRKDWNTLIGAQKVKAWNDGLRDLLTQAKQVIGHNKKVIYNGISPADWKVNRNLQLLQIADGALNERFCLTKENRQIKKADKMQLLEDIKIETDYGGSPTQTDRPEPQIGLAQIKEPNIERCFGDPAPPQHSGEQDYFVERSMQLCPSWPLYVLANQPEIITWLRESEADIDQPRAQGRPG